MAKKLHILWILELFLWSNRCKWYLYLKLQLHINKAWLNPFGAIIHWNQLYLEMLLISSGPWHHIPIRKLSLTLLPPQNSATLAIFVAICWNLSLVFQAYFMFRSLLIVQLTAAASSNKFKTRLFFHIYIEALQIFANIFDLNWNTWLFNVHLTNSKYGFHVIVRCSTEYK